MIMFLLLFTRRAVLLDEFVLVNYLQRKIRLTFDIQSKYFCSFMI